MYGARKQPRFFVPRVGTERGVSFPPNRNSRNTGKNAAAFKDDDDNDDDNDNDDDKDDDKGWRIEDNDNDRGNKNDDDDDKRLRRSQRKKRR